MATTTPAKVQKVTITLPKELLARLDEFIPKRQRSHFVALAVQEQLALFEQVAALAESSGAWLDENHPELQSEEDMDDWLAGIRGLWAGHG
jgi:hypothetical protein